SARNVPQWVFDGIRRLHRHADRDSAYITALLALNFTHDLLISFLLASVTGVLVSLVVALPSLRLKNEYFLIATMGFQAIIFSLFMNLEITGVASGYAATPHPPLFCTLC